MTGGGPAFQGDQGLLLEITREMYLPRDTNLGTALLQGILLDRGAKCRVLNRWDTENPSDCRVLSRWDTENPSDVYSTLGPTVQQNPS